LFSKTLDNKLVSSNFFSLSNFFLLSALLSVKLTGFNGGIDSRGLILLLLYLFLLTNLLSIFIKLSQLDAKFRFSSFLSFNNELVFSLFELSLLFIFEFFDLLEVERFFHVLFNSQLISKSDKLLFGLYNKEKL
jgi:hypothetical protein